MRRGQSQGDDEDDCSCGRESFPGKAKKKSRALRPSYSVRRTDRRDDDQEIMMTSNMIHLPGGREAEESGVGG